MDIDLLTKNFLLKKYTETIGVVIKRNLPSNFNEQPLKVSEEESFDIKCFYKINDILDTFNSLNISIQMLSGFNQVKLKGVADRGQYIAFGIENFYLRLTSIFDRCLRLVNVAFQIGLPERVCNNSTIIKNEKIKPTEVAKCLTKIEKFTNKYKKQRNEIAHSNNFADKIMRDHDSYCYLMGTNSAKEVNHLSDQMRDHANKYIKNKKSEFMKILNEMIVLVDEFFSSIDKQLN